jgi:Phospholipase_D-nuclease N-terminal/Short C-terminal domain
MVFAADYPFMDVLWTMIIFFLFVVWIWMMVVILNDVFRRRDISGWAKAGWTVFLLVLPWLGALVYLIANGADMTTRAVSDTAVTQAEYDYVRSTTANGGPAAEIAQAKELLDSGAISETEFDAIKAKVIA